MGSPDLRVGDWRVIFVESADAVEVRAVGNRRDIYNDGTGLKGQPQIIHTEAEDLVVITLSDYEALLARAGDEAAEDEMTARIVAATAAKIACGEDVILPAAVWQAIQNGAHAIRAIRKHRDLTQIDVAERAGLRQNDIADMKAGRTPGSAASLKAVAAALEVPLDVIME